MTSPAAMLWKAYAGLPLKERLFVQARLWSAPLDELARLAALGRVAEIGCGHGALCALLHWHGASEVVGVDVDARKVAWARQAIGGMAQLVDGGVEVLKHLSGTMDAVVVADVVYLIPERERLAFFIACRSLLNARGRLCVKEAIDDGSWKARKALLQEAVMVRLLRRTRSSGAVVLPKASAIEADLRAAGFSKIAITNYAGYTTPHQLFVASGDC
jgi:cyclopropane fatty-acyl-phospholipid synthase-like methyltransferase